MCNQGADHVAKKTAKANNWNPVLSHVQSPKSSQREEKKEKQLK